MLICSFALYTSLCHLSYSLSLSRLLFLLLRWVYHLIIFMCNIVDFPVHTIGCCCLLLLHLWNEEREREKERERARNAKEKERERDSRIWKAGKTVWIVHVEKHVVHVEVYTTENNFQALLRIYSCENKNNNTNAPQQMKEMKKKKQNERQQQET